MKHCLSLFSFCLLLPGFQIASAQTSLQGTVNGGFGATFPANATGSSGWVDLRFRHEIPVDIFDFSLSGHVQSGSEQISVGGQMQYRAFTVALGVVPNLFRDSGYAIAGIGPSYRDVAYPGPDTAARLGFALSLRELSIAVALSQAYLRLTQADIDQDGDGVTDDGRPETHWSEFETMIRLPLTRSISFGYYFSGGYTEEHVAFTQRGHAFGFLLETGNLELALNGAVFENAAASEDGSIDNDSHLTVSAAWGGGDFFTTGFLRVIFGGGADLRQPAKNYDAYDRFTGAVAVGYVFAPAITLGLEAGFMSPNMATNAPDVKDGGSVSIDLFLRMTF